MENIVKVDFTVKMNKSIYGTSPWKTREEFIQETVLNHLGHDHNLLERQSKTMDEAKQEEYKPFLKTLKGLQDCINESIKYDLISVDGNIEEVKISFSFKYYETPLITLERTLDAFIFNATVQDTQDIVEDLERMKNLGKVPDDKKEKVDESILMFKHLVEFMEEAKSSVVVTKDGIVLDSIYEPKSKKLKM